MKKISVLFLFAIYVVSVLFTGVAMAQNNCVGATYLNHGVCTACPIGYDYNTTEGKTSVSECQTYCDGGTYIGTKNGLCTDVGAGFWAGAGAVNYGSVGVRGACMFQRQTTENMFLTHYASVPDSGFKKCPFGHFFTKHKFCHIFWIIAKKSPAGDFLFCK